MIKDYFDEQLGTSMDTNSGQTRYLCPFCHESNYKFYVNTDEGSERVGLWDCKHCKESGNFIQFIMKINNIGFNNAKDIAINYGAGFDSRNYNPESSDKEQLILALESNTGILKNESNLNDQATNNIYPTIFPTEFKLLEDNLYNPEAYPYFAYCQSRGFSIDDIRSYHIGYCPFSRVYDLDGNYLTSIYKSLIFTTYDFHGLPIYWNTRSIVKSPVKAKNAPEIEGHYSKRNCVFNLNVAKSQPYLILTEGVPDAITLGAPAVATFGKAVSNEQVDLICSSVPKETPIIVLLDMDAKNIMIELAKRISRQHPNVYMVFNPTNRDANSLGKDRIYSIIRDYKVKYSVKSAMLFGLN